MKIIPVNGKVDGLILNKSGYLYIYNGTISMKFMKRSILLFVILSSLNHRIFSQVTFNIAIQKENNLTSAN
ncbi:MAG: hypothetical protein ACXVNM_14560, partial [Bacteroidia bacterium]